MNLRGLPKIRDSLSYLYVEHCCIEKDNSALKLIDASGVVPIPIASLSVLMLGPGTKITHDAVTIAVQNGCSLVWTGEEGVRTYAAGTGETRSSTRLLHQIHQWANEERRLQIVIKMYQFRFPDPIEKGFTLQQIRGKEGARVRDTYARLSQEYNVPWRGRSYNRNSWSNAEPINRAISCANSCLYGVCHAAIVSSGYSPAIGFIHIGKQLSFVYDIADLYKVELTLPVAFKVVSENNPNIESTVRHQLRDQFRELRILDRIVSDIDQLLQPPEETNYDLDHDFARPLDYWEPPKDLEDKMLCS